jgi:formate/nitrite transporter FocA (FNT family)
VSTALAAGFDIVAGVVTLILLESQLEHWMGKHAAHVFASFGFGIGFVFLIVGRAELFTENFLVPIAGLDHRSGASWRNLAKLWLTSTIFNIVGGLLMILLLTVHSVLPYGSGNFALAAAGNIVGGAGLVTLNRLTQGKHGEAARSGT